jgi:PTH1 family peptidyl-tRNA hydrolase
VKAGGGNAGHNGLRSISAHLDNDYKRVRLGIGHPGAKAAVVYYVLNDFAKSERGWLSDLLDAVSDAAPYLAKGDDARFLSDVAKLLYSEPRSEAPQRKDKDSSEENTPRPVKKPASTSHPAGERSSKRQSALAENLKKWLGARKSGDDSA